MTMMMFHDYNIFQQTDIFSTKLFNIMKRLICVHVPVALQLFFRFFSDKSGLCFAVSGTLCQICHEICLSRTSGQCSRPVRGAKWALGLSAIHPSGVHPHIA